MNPPPPLGGVLIDSSILFFCIPLCGNFWMCYGTAYCDFIVWGDSVVTEEYSAGCRVLAWNVKW